MPRAKNVIHKNGTIMKFPIYVYGPVLKTYSVFEKIKNSGPTAFFADFSL
jgi:hypothetical protein